MIGSDGDYVTGERMLEELRSFTLQITCSWFPSLIGIPVSAIPTSSCLTL